MVGSFDFGSGDYERHVEMWTNIVLELDLPISYVNVQLTTISERNGLRLAFELASFGSEA